MPRIGMRGRSTTPPEPDHETNRTPHRHRFRRVTTVLVTLLGVTGAGLAGWAGGASAAPAPPPTAAKLAPNDPAIGLWQFGKTTLDVLPTGEVRFVASGVACQVGAIEGKDFTNVGPGKYKVNSGDFGANGCTAKSYKPLTLTLADNKISPPGGPFFTRPAPSGLAATDPIIGRWRSPDGKVINEVRPDGTVRIVQATACQVGKLDSYDLKLVTPGNYTVRNGNFKTGQCAANSFTPGYKLTVGPDGLRPGGGSKGKPWTKVEALSPKQKNSVLVIHHNSDGRWVPCGLVVFDKTEEAQDLLAKLGLQTPGLHVMGRGETAKLDDVLLRKNADNEFTNDLYRPIAEAVKAAAAGPVGQVVPVQVDGDAQKSFRAVCVRRA